MIYFLHFRKQKQNEKKLYFTRHEIQYLKFVFIFVVHKYSINPILLLWKSRLRRKSTRGTIYMRIEKLGSWTSTLRSLCDYDWVDIHGIITLWRVYKSLSLNILKSRENCLFLVGVERKLMAGRGQTRVENITTLI